MRSVFMKLGVVTWRERELSHGGAAAAERGAGGGNVNIRVKTFGNVKSQDFMFLESSSRFLCEWD